MRQINLLYTHALNKRVPTVDVREVSKNSEMKTLKMSDQPAAKKASPKALKTGVNSLTPIIAFCLPLIAVLSLASPTLVHAAPGDVDDDGVPDYLDVDDDNDGITDSQEGYTAVNQLLNPSFELFDPSLAMQTFGSAPNRSFQFDQEDVLGWQTNSPDGQIEIWESNHNGSDPAPTPSLDGNAHTEINSTASVALFQEIRTQPGETLIWSVWHRGRRDVDITEVKIGSATVAIADMPVIETMSTGRTAWANYSGVYVVPPGQTLTRISFENVETANTIAAVGNFIDRVTLERISTVDTDGDGLPDHQDPDSDNDGIPDSTEGHDVDANGIPDILPSGNDTDGDGVDDAYDADNSGTEAPEPDVDGDSIPDHRDLDSDGDGILDAVEGPVDTDQDGMPNYLDPDSDGDGIPDSREGFDADRNGVPDIAPTGSDSDSDGLDNAFDPDVGGTPAPVQDTDNDGRPDYIDIDSDDDELLDEDEKGSDPDSPLDEDNDGTPDYLEIDGDPSATPTPPEPSAEPGEEPDSGAAEGDGIIHTGLDRLACSIATPGRTTTDPLFVLLLALASLILCLRGLFKRI